MTRTVEKYGLLFKRGHFVTSPPELLQPGTCTSERKINQVMDFHNSVLMLFFFLAGGKRKSSFSVSGNDVCKWKPQPEMNEILKPISNTEASI